MRTRENFIDLFITGKPLPELEDSEVTMPEGVYVCLNCGKVNNYFHSICDSCENELDVRGEL